MPTARDAQQKLPVDDCPGGVGDSFRFSETAFPLELLAQRRQHPPKDDRCMAAQRRGKSVGPPRDRPAGYTGGHTMNRILAWVLARMQERSTWLGVTALL